MTFSEQIMYGLCKPTKYKELVQLKKSRFVLYVVVLMLVMGIVRFVVPTAAMIAGFGGFESLFTEKMGTMEYNEESLTIDKPFKMNCNGINILINTEQDIVPDEELTNKNTVYMAVGSKTIRMAIPTVEGWIDYMTVDLKDVISPGFNNESLMSIVPSLYLGLFFSFIATCIGYFLKYGLFALVLSICVHSMNKHLETGFTYGQILMICFYGESLGMIISNFNIAMGLLPSMLVSMITVFMSVQFITNAVVMSNRTHQL